MARLPRVLMIVAVAVPLLSAACGPAKNPQPTVDPVKEQITILQKQLLELQNSQNETRRRVDEQAIATNALSGRVRSLEEQRTPLPPAASSATLSSKQTLTQQIAPAKKPPKKPVKKKKPVRRQEP